MYGLYVIIFGVCITGITCFEVWHFLDISKIVQIRAENNVAISVEVATDADISEKKVISTLIYKNMLLSIAKTNGLCK